MQFGHPKNEDFNIFPQKLIWYGYPYGYSPKRQNAGFTQTNQ